MKKLQKILCYSGTVEERVATIVDNKVKWISKDMNTQEKDFALERATLLREIEFLRTTLRREELFRMSREDITNILDALIEWYDTCGPKELSEDDIGLDDDRYNNIKNAMTAYLQQCTQD